MSLTKLLKAPIKLFKKEVITFLIIRRYDLGIIDNKLRYIAVKPSASISVLRQKVWHLLDLPDYCEEIIILKSNSDVVVPLSELRKGNDPQHPYVLEVWLTEKTARSTHSILRNHMLEIANGDAKSQTSLENQHTSNDVVYEENQRKVYTHSYGEEATLQKPTMNNSTKNPPVHHHNFLSEFKKSDMSVRISSSSLFKISSRKSKDNIANVLMKIQSDLCTLSNKLSALENKMVP